MAAVDCGPGASRSADQEVAQGDFHWAANRVLASLLPEALPDIPAGRVPLVLPGALHLSSGAPGSAASLTGDRVIGCGQGPLAARCHLPPKDQPWGPGTAEPERMLGSQPTNGIRGHGCRKVSGSCKAFLDGPASPLPASTLLLTERSPCVVYFAIMSCHRIDFRCPCRPPDAGADPETLGHITCLHRTLQGLRMRPCTRTELPVS